MSQITKIKRSKIISNGYVSLCRFGGINKMTKQKGNYNTKNEPTRYHKAPERYGFYAFVYPFVEPFLLGGVANGGKGRLNQFGKPNQCKKFKATDGYLWTHIEPKNKSMIVVEKGSWYKIHVKDFAIVLKQHIAEMTGETFAFYTKDWGDRQKTVRCGLTIKNPYAAHSKDHLEVFICRDTEIS